MHAPQLARLGHAARVRNDSDLGDHSLSVVAHSDGFAGGVQASLQALIVGRDSGRAGITVAL
jgi:hypothetical protein